MGEVNYEVNFHDEAELRTSIGAYTRNGKDFYIGMTSGPSTREDDVKRAMGTRYDASKRSKGINRMIAIFKTKSEQKCEQVESDLIEHYQRKLLNRTGGGGGRDTSQSWKFVYIGIKN